VYFYELHEGDHDVFHDLLLTHEMEIDPETFFEIVTSIRKRVQDSFEQDTLIEAIADELEREHDFEVIRDERLTAAVNVSTNEAENFLAETSADEGDDDLDEDADLNDDANFRTLYARFPRDEAQ
jgi:hypothetical protein